MLRLLKYFGLCASCLLIFAVTVAADPPTCSYNELLFFAEYVPRREQAGYVPYYVAKNISRVEECAKFCHETYFCNVALYDPETQRCQIVYPKDKKCYLFNTRYRRYNPFGSTLIQCISCGDFDYKSRRFELPNGGLGGKGAEAARAGRFRFPNGNYGSPYGNSFGESGSGYGSGGYGSGGYGSGENCVPNLCRNGGNILLYHDNTYECVCRKGYVGRLCDDVEENEVAGQLIARSNHTELQRLVQRTCTPNPCRNSGLCLPGARRHFCICQPEFTGSFCEFLIKYSKNR